jgi:chromosome segregation protein
MRHSIIRLGVVVILKSIELFGFKSFALKTKIEIKDGISAIIGPNGCGKSNILDAIKWALGEQSAKNLRASKMEDVIFNGTEKTKALNVAEVSLLLCNNDNLFPLEMSEISIKRRLYRSSESEYFINNTPAKLKEVRELFFDTGIGKNAYSIMEQGKIDQILSNKPEERRYIFEEAAGITGYKAKRTEAEKKLEKTVQHIKQIQGILGEVKRSYHSLQQQAQKTKKYREISDDIFHNELSIQLLRLKNLLERKGKQEKMLYGISQERDLVKNDIDQLNSMVATNIDLVNNLETRLVDIQKKLYGLDIEKNNKDTQIKILNERTSELERKINFDENRGKSIRQKIERLKQEKREKQNDLQELNKQISVIDRNIIDFEHNVELSTITIKNNREQIAALEKELLDLDEELEHLREKLREITDDIVTQLDQRLKESGYSAQEKSSIEKSLDDILDYLRIQIQGKKSILEDAHRIGELKANALKTLQATFIQLSFKIEEFVNIFEKYKRATPTFLDEFLSPHGIITQKRVIDNKINDTLKHIALNRQQINQLQEEINTLNKKIEEYRKTLEELRVNRATIYTQKTVLSDTMKRIENEVEEQENMERENLKEIEQTQKNISDIINNISRLKNEKIKTEEEEKALKKNIHILEEEISHKNKSLLNNEKLLKDKMNSLEKVQKQVEESQVLAATVNTEIKNLEENFKDKYSRDLADFKSEMENIKKQLPDLKEENTKLKNQIRDLGHVNLMALEEFSEIKERYEFLETQLDDLKKAQTDLLQITEKIRTESTRRFVDTYEIIRKNFNTIFRQLFGGGRAECKLIEKKEILESGIEIFAQPPGKKLENIDLLSGGERSLTAIALLFAIYMVKPSPFCVLDEIDAALDDKNIGKFVSMLKEFADKSQFLIITHNKKTVTSADCLLGITMEESGISKLISIKLQDRKSEEVYV